MQTDPVVEYRPSVYIIHLEELVAPAGDPVPAAQSRHAVLLFATRVPMYLPKLQTTHPDPVISYFPAAHTPHTARLLLGQSR